MVSAGVKNKYYFKHLEKCLYKWILLPFRPVPPLFCMCADQFPHGQEQKLSAKGSALTPVYISHIHDWKFWFIRLCYISVPRKKIIWQTFFRRIKQTKQIIKEMDNNISEVLNKAFICDLNEQYPTDTCFWACLVNTI